MAAPTLMTATPPASFARRSWSFSLSKSLVVSSIWALICFDAGQDLVLVAATLDEGGLVLGRRDAASAAEVLDRRRVELAAGLFGDDLATREDRDVLEHRLAAVTEARRLDAEHVERAAELVHDERGECLAVDVLGDDDEVLGDLHELLEHGQDVGDRGDLLVGDEDVRILDGRFHAVGVRDEVRRDVTAVDLHSLDELGLELQALRLLDGDHAVAADLVHDVSDELTDRLVGGGDRRDLRDLVLALDFLRVGLDGLDDGSATLFEATLQEHRVRASGDVAKTLVHDRLREDDRRGRAVTGDVVGLGGSFLEELRAHVLERVLELDLAATVTPSWVTVGEPNFLSSATLRPFGPSVVFTAFAMTSTPCFSFFRASSVKTSCFAINSLSLTRQ